jgi:hypothetical protein
MLRVEVATLAPAPPILGFHLAQAMPIPYIAYKCESSRHGVTSVEPQPSDTCSIDRNDECWDS